MSLYLFRFEKPVALGCRTRLPYQGSSSALREVWCYGDETELANCNAGYGDSRTCLVNKEATGVCGKFLHYDCNPMNTDDNLTKCTGSKRFLTDAEFQTHIFSF